MCLQAAACQPGLSVCADPSLAAEQLKRPYVGCKLRRIQGLLGSARPWLCSNWCAAPWCSPGSSSTSCSPSFCLLPRPNEIVQKGALPSPMCIVVSCSCQKTSACCSLYPRTRLSQGAHQVHQREVCWSCWLGRSRVISFTVCASLANCRAGLPLQAGLT